MNLEIERKFLVTNSDYKKLSFQKKYIQQGFLNSNKDRVVRVRILDKQGFLTIKGISNTSGKINSIAPHYIIHHLCS